MIEVFDWDRTELETLVDIEPARVVFVRHEGRDQGYYVAADYFLDQCASKDNNRHEDHGEIDMPSMT